MKAYEGIISKEEFIKELEWHYEQDNFVKGQYFKDGKGCAVGCSLESISRKKNVKINFDNHSEYPKFLGIPEWLAKVEDVLFEGLSDTDSKAWPLRFSKAVSTGQDLEKIKAPFIIYVLESNLERLKDEKFKNQKLSVERCIKLWQRNDLYSDKWEKERSAAESAAWSAARSAAESAAESAARSAAWSAAESAAWSAWSAAESAARSAAESAAWSAWSAAESAARSAAESAAESAARSAWSARSAAYKKFADKLIELIKEIK